MSEQQLRQEIEFFDQQLPGLLNTSEGEFALIYRQQLHGTFSTMDEAIASGYEQFGNVPFLVRLIAREREVATVSTLRRADDDAQRNRR